MHTYIKLLSERGLFRSQNHKHVSINYKLTITYIYKQTRNFISDLILINSSWPASHQTTHLGGGTCRKMYLRNLFILRGLALYLYIS